MVADIENCDYLIT